MIIKPRKFAKRQCKLQWLTPPSTRVESFVPYFILIALIQGLACLPRAKAMLSDYPYALSIPTRRKEGRTVCLCYGYTQLLNTNLASDVL